MTKTTAVTVAQIAIGIGGFLFKAIQNNKMNRRNTTVDFITNTFRSVAKATKLKETDEKEVKSAAESAVDAFEEATKFIKGKRHTALASILYALSLSNKVRKNSSVNTNGEPKSTIGKIVDTILEDVKAPKASSEVTQHHFNNVTSIIETIMGTKGNLKVAQFGATIPTDIKENPVVIGLTHLVNTLSDPQERRIQFDNLFNPYKKGYMGNDSLSKIVPTEFFMMEIAGLLHAIRTETDSNRKAKFQRRFDLMNELVKG